MTFITKPILYFVHFYPQTRQNLYEVLKKNDFRGFTMHSLRKIATKLLNCLGALRKRGIIHCDLKPENILIGTKNSSDLCVIDFGSSCYTNKRVYTYIQSRFYRAPEISGLHIMVLDSISGVLDAPFLNSSRVSYSIT
ncbi:Dual specificity tyrosine-phosphorylation-regulated kinase 2 [Fasciola gigantica]|uniref:Dual specificity tyrosine-phosphorylation-regulated kinase 2 n=1 Tax=Fasciola gigantica TaxID=46835 RepID=A0A504YSE0_FASGI|nr:Dual specificity tyrosine-phosphorylation-regulated kinase 2 [Fasciola gigantica]